jgi:hypothetical protein
VALQSIPEENWELNVAVECHDLDCTNVITPRGVQFMQEMHSLIADDKRWQKLCLKDAMTGSCDGNSLPGGSSAIASVVPIFTAAFGNDLSELT